MTDIIEGARTEGLKEKDLGNLQLNELETNVSNNIEGTFKENIQLEKSGLEQNMLDKIDDENVKTNLLSQYQKHHISKEDIDREIQAYFDIQNKIVANSEFEKLFNQFKKTKLPSSILKEFTAYDTLKSKEPQVLINLSLKAGRFPREILNKLEDYQWLNDNATNEKGKAYALKYLENGCSIGEAKDIYESYIDIENINDHDVKDLAFAFMDKGTRPDWVDFKLCENIAEYGHDIVKETVGWMEKQKNLTEQGVLYFAYTYHLSKGN